MRRFKVFFRSVRLSVRLKSVPSRMVSVLGFPAAFLPMLISLRLAAFADSVWALFGSSGLLRPALLSFGSVMLLYLLQTFFNLVRNFYAREDAARIKRYVKEETMGLLCRIPYKYIENFDGFQEQLAFIKTYGGEKTAGSISLILGWLSRLVSFVSAAAILSQVSISIVFVLMAACVPAAVLSILQRDETYRMRTKWMKEGRLTVYYSDVCRMNEPMNEIRFFGLYPYIKDKWNSLSQVYIAKKRKIIQKHVLYNSIADLLRNGVYLIVILIAVWEIYHDPAKGLGAFMLVVSLAEQLQAVTTVLLVDAVAIFTDVRYMEDFLSLLETEEAEVSEIWGEERGSKRAEVQRAAHGSERAEAQKAVHGAERAEAQKAALGSERAEAQKAALGSERAEAQEAAHGAERAEAQRAAHEPKTADIEFRDVSFTYPGSVEKALDGVTVRIRQGEKIAVVGANGSGKSTFISLLCGFYRPDSGKVLVGGCDIMKDETLKKLRSSVSAIFQTFCRYQDTLRSNIVLSDSGRVNEDQEILELARSTGAEEAIKGQKNALDEMVGVFSDTGNNLSGGQWQKIAITRALYRKNACVYILDEPTAALDPIGEANIYRNFKQLTGDKTTILISHRLGIAKVVDRILVFHKGRIAEDGSHEELMEKNGLYARMYRAQARWYT